MEGIMQQKNLLDKYICCVLVYNKIKTTVS